MIDLIIRWTFIKCFWIIRKTYLIKEKIIVCGDVNTAHKEIDIARPKENEKISGFLPMERAWIDRFIEIGFIDTFRHFNKNPGNYSWWIIKVKQDIEMWVGELIISILVLTY